MALDTMLWNIDKTQSVRASRVRNFGIYQEPYIPGSLTAIATKGYRFKLLGWFNQNEYFYFGSWDTEEEARAYLEGLHKQIEGR